MEQEFITIIKKMTAEQGVQSLLGNAWRKWLPDYMGSRYAKETKLFRQILDTGCADHINSADNVPERKQALLERLESDRHLSPKAVAEYLDLLGMILKGDMSKCREQPAPEGFVNIPGGTFTMGSPANEAGRDEDEVQHQVRVSRFCLGKYEVTQGEWEEVMEYNPSEFEGANLPVEGISWYDAVEYCNKRSVKEGLSPVYTINGTNVNWNRSANGYRLPTEAEWEYACRAGTTTPYNTGTMIDNAGWYERNSDAETHPAGKKQPNAWGLYDMHGNVWERCWDWYGSYSSNAQTDPMGASPGTHRVIRGGCWSNPAAEVRSASRGSYSPVGLSDGLGFRLARSLV